MSHVAPALGLKFNDIHGILMRFILFYYFFACHPGHFLTGKIRETCNQFGLALALATKTSGAAKVYWRRLNSKRSLPVLKWASESEYFERQKKVFADL